jgi:vacuolar-type H+-ATPase subunit F/Vma7
LQKALAKKIAFIGDLQTILGFKSLGSVVYEVSKKEELQAIMDKVMKEDFGTIFITDEVESWLGDDIIKLENKTVVLTIPSCKTRKDMGFKNLERLVEKSIGIAKLFDKV